MMKVERKSLTALVKSVMPAINKRAKDEWKTILLVSQNGKLTASASDGDVFVRRTIDAPEAEPETFLLSAARLNSLLSVADGDDVTISQKKTSVEIRYQRSQFKLNGYDPNDFAGRQTTLDTDRELIGIDVKPFRRALDLTSYAADEESTRYALGAVHIGSHNGRLEVAATDSRRLALVKLDTPADFKKILIPARAAQLVLSGLEGHETADMLWNENMVGFESEGFSMQCLQTEGRFPQYHDVIPQDGDEVAFVVASLTTALRQAAILTNTESRAVDFQFADDSLTLLTKTADVGSSNVSIPCGYGDDLTVALDPLYLLPMLAKLPNEDQIRLYLTDGDSAVRFEHSDFTYIQMPLSR